MRIDGAPNNLHSTGLNAEREALARNAQTYVKGLGKAMAVFVSYLSFMFPCLVFLLPWSVAYQRFWLDALRHAALSRMPEQRFASRRKELQTALKEETRCQKIT